MKSIHRKAVAATIALALSLLAGGPAAAQDIKERVIRWGHLVDQGNPISLGVVRFTEIVGKKSDGRMKIREFGNSQLGNEMQQQSALRGGTQEMFTSAPTSLVGLVREFGLLDLPFSFGSIEEAFAVLDGPFGKLLLARLAEKDIVGLAFWDLGGFRNATNSRRPITRAADFNGLKMRVIANPVYIETFRLLGANPVPMNFGEVYTALESKAIDGQENPFSVIRSAKLYEVQRYLSLTNHTLSPNLVQVSRKLWDGLSAAEQRVLREAAAESLAYQRQVGLSQSQSVLSELKSKGMVVNEIAPAELEQMRQATRPVAEKFVTQLDPEVVKVFQAELAKARNR